MSGASQTSDSDIVDLLRQTGSMCVSELAVATDVTPTAVRQRLSRLMEQGLVGRHALRSGRGRPSHRYVLTEKGQRQSGSNFVDLAMMLWQEIRSISDPSVRRGLIARLAKRMASLYADRIEGETTEERMQAVAGVFGERNVPLAVETVAAGARSARGPVGDNPLGDNPLKVIEIDATKSESAAGTTKTAGPASEAAVLTVWACPYPELAEVDRGICAMERMMFAECCRFQTGPLAVSNPVASG